MGVWKTLPGYPSREDIKYEISSYLFKEGKVEGGFSLTTLNSLYGKGWEDTEHYSVVQEMIEDGEILKIEKNTGGKDWYKIDN